MKSFHRTSGRYGCVPAIIGLLFVIVLIASGCYTQKKAEQHVVKAHDKYPVMVANKTRSWFPCITTAFDSSEYLSSLEYQRQLLVEYDSILNLTGLKNDSLLSVLEKMKTDTSDAMFVDCSNCGDLIGNCIELARQNKTLTNTINKLRFAPAPAPIIKYIRDDADVFVARNSADSANRAARDWESKYVAQRDISDRWAKRTRWALIVPWWVFIIVAGGIFAMLKFRILNFKI
jgi:hypothetical protein